MHPSSYLDEVDERLLLQEVEKRLAARRRGLCDYCFRDVQTTRACKFPDRHVLKIPKEGS